MKNIKLLSIFLLIAIFLAIIIYMLKYYDPTNCKHIVEIDLEEIKIEMDSERVTETTYNLYNGSYSIDAKFGIKKVGEEEYNISKLEDAEISNAPDYYIKYVEYCADLGELWIIVSNDGGQSLKSIPIDNLKLDRTVKEVVVFEWDNLPVNYGLDSTHICGEDFQGEAKPESKKGSIIIGSK